MRYFKIIIFLLFYSSAYSVELPVVKCEKQVSNLTKKWKVIQNWTKRSNSLFAAPTSKFGQWVLFKLEKSGVTLTLANSKKDIRVHISKKCESKVRVVQKNGNPRDIFGDDLLKSKMSLNKGIIYLWSTHMPLSVKGIPNIKKAAKELNVKLIILQDENSHELQGLNIATQKLKSFDLKMRNAYLHFPTLLAFDQGLIKNTIKYGYEKTDEYKKDIQNMLMY